MVVEHDQLVDGAARAGRRAGCRRSGRSAPTGPRCGRCARAPSPARETISVVGSSGTSLTSATAPFRRPGSAVRRSSPYWAWHRPRFPRPRRRGGRASESSRMIQARRLRPRSSSSSSLDLDGLRAAPAGAGGFPGCPRPGCRSGLKRAISAALGSSRFADDRDHLVDVEQHRPAGLRGCGCARSPCSAGGWVRRVTVCHAGNRHHSLEDLTAATFWRGLAVERRAWSG